jgi:hypothetical protein
MSLLSFPLVQARQAKLLEACGFPCNPAGDKDFAGTMVPMFIPSGDKKNAVADVIGYGGAAFGGKSYGLLILARVAAELWPGVQITYFRRTYPELNGPGASMQKAYEVFNGTGATATDGGKEWKFPNKSVFYFRHCQNEADVYNYQSQQFDILLTDESTHFSWQIIDYLLTRNRVSGDIPGFQPFAVMPSNPGNIGHVWYSQLFDVAKIEGEHEIVKRTLNPNGKYSNIYFIPAFLEDNQIGVARDPGYEDRLMERDIEVAKALRYGDWTVFAGQAFPTWRQDRIACKAFDIPEWWPKWRALDYGFEHPFTCGWFALDPDKKRIYIYRAVLQSGKTDKQQARMIAAMTPPDEKIPLTYASPDMWARKNIDDRVTTSVDQYKEEGIVLTRADNDRLQGKRKIDRLLVDLPDDRPGIQIFEEYYPVFKCMTTLVRSSNNPEDVEKVDGDDSYDMVRYGLSNTNPAPRKQQTNTDQGNPLARRSAL